MSKRDYTALDKSSFTDLGTASTGNQGVITYSNLHKGDTVTFVFTGPTDTVYSQTVAIYDESPQTIAVTMPSKGQFVTELRVADNAVDKWVELYENEDEKLREFEVHFYYKIFKNDKTADDYNDLQVKDPSSGFVPVKMEAVSPSKREDKFMDIAVDLPDIPIQSYFKFLVTVDYYNVGTEFVMHNTVDEMSQKPITIYLE
jgi:hypothetical protein